MLTKKEALKRLGICVLLLLGVVATVVYLFDPFYQYHGPLPGMNPVLYDRDYQVAGTIRNMEYDSVLLGSSVAENFDSDYLDRQLGSKTLKVVRASASTADLLYYLNQIHEEKELKNVFWCMDIFALTEPVEVTVLEEKTLRYLHTDSIWDDEEYLFNKDILLMKIPLSVAYSVMGRNVGGKGYDWSSDKEFSASKAMRSYNKQGNVVPEQPMQEQRALLIENLQMILQEIEEHQEIDYTVIFPPYSMIWWDCGYSNGMGELYFHILEETLPKLCEFENVDLYYFQDNKEIVCNLDNYMDMIHYAPWVNQYMLEAVIKEEGKVSRENVSVIIENMRELYQYIISEGIYEYYERK